MNFLLDTNLVSEWAKPKPNAGVVRWLAEADEDRVYISVVVFAEIRLGIELLPTGRRRERLTQWLAEELPLRFEGRILAIDQQVAGTWGVITARSRQVGRTIGSTDAWVAAIASTYQLTLVTRNTPDFASTGVALFNPWQSRD